MTTDTLIVAAERFDVATEESAGPGGLPGVQIWSQWPKNRLEIAHDLLDRVLSQDKSVAVVSVSPDQWRAQDDESSWSFTGTFEETIAALALHVAEDAQRKDGRPRRRTMAARVRH